MYKMEKRVVEDMVISESCPGGKRIFTGGKSVLELPFTISFNAKGDYLVHIGSTGITVDRMEAET